MTEGDPIRCRLAEATAGEYDIVGELGRGGMATVYLAHERALDRRVAIKVMAPQLVAVDGMAERFLQEARVAAALAHPHIIPIHAVRRSGDLLYFVMKHVAGRSLDAVLAERGSLGVPMVRAILTQVGAALEAAHRKGVIHRDIKPANILLDERGDAVVADFGIARETAQQGRTEVGQTVGTPEYMSAEQCAGGALTGAADQYSLGVVAYELLAGAPPFRGDDLLQVVWKMVNEPAVRVTDHRPDCPGALADAIERMMARAAADRFASVGDAIAALPPLVLEPEDPVRSELVALATCRVGRSAEPAAAITVVSSRSLEVGAVRAVAALRLPFAAGVMSLDDVVRLVPEAVDVAGASALAPELTWESSDPAVVRVSPAGDLTAVGTGRATVSARAGDAMCTLAILVTRAGLRDLALVAGPKPMEVGDRLALGVAVGAASGQLPHARLVQWETSDPAVATVDGMGRVTARAEGNAEISGRAGGAVGRTTIRVTRAVISAVNVTAAAKRIAIGERMRFEAAPANTKGHPLPGLPVQWEVSDPAIAAISAEGELVALRSGQVLVAARVAGRVGTTRVTVASSA